MVQKRLPNYEAHFEDDDSASSSLFLDVLLHHDDQGERLVDSIFRLVDG